MENKGLKAPIPIRKKPLVELRGLGCPFAKANSTADLTCSKLSNQLSPDFKQSLLRARSATPTTQKLFNDMDSEEILKQRLNFYNLNYVVDTTEHKKNIYNKSSQWFSRDVKPELPIKDCLPYQTETHLEQARYLCHVMVNLSIAINSLDIQGLISISSKDLAEFKQETENLALQTDLFTLEKGPDDFEYDNINDIDIGEDENEDDEGHLDFNATGKITAKSASIINVNHWTNELKNCLDFNFPLTLRRKLVTVYYYLSLVQGQKIHRQMYVEVFESLISTDDDGTNFSDLLYDDGFRLDSKGLYDFLYEFLPYPDSEYVKKDISSKEDLHLFRLLLRLADNAKLFFEDINGTLMKNYMDTLLSRLAPSTMSSIMPMITSSVPYHHHKDFKITDYFSFFYSLWSSVSANVAIDTHMYDFVGNIAKDTHWKLVKRSEFSNEINLDRFGIFTEDQLNFMFNRLQCHLRADGQIHSHSRTVRPFIYSLNGSDAGEYFNKLSGLATSIKTYVHPSNSGFWTKTIAKFIHCFIKVYHNRAKREEELLKSENKTNDFVLTPKCHAKIVSIFIDILVTGSQNKNSNVSNYYISCFPYLLDMYPSNSHFIFDKLLADLYEALSGEYVNSRHRIISSLKQFTKIVRFMVIDKLYRVHITNILIILIGKIDMNDIQLTSNIFNGIVTIVSYIPLENLTKEDEYLTFESHTLPFIEQHYYFLKTNDLDSNFKYDSDFLDQAFRASTTIFQDAFREYIDKIYQLVNIDLEDGVITKINNTSMVMFESMDDDMFTFFVELFEKAFWDIDSFGEAHPNFELISIPMAAFVKRDSSRIKGVFERLVYNIKLQIEKGAGSLRSSTEIQQRDYKLVLYLTALNDVLRHSHSSILEFHEDLVDFMKFLYSEITNPPLDVITSILSHSTLASLTATEVIECRLFSKRSKIPQEDRWGGVQFNKCKFNEEELDFTWHVPSQDEINVAIDIVATISKFCKSNIVSLIEEGPLDSKTSDQIQKYILIMTHSLSGASLLFDPDFNRNRSRSPKEMSYKERLLLLKNIRENGCDNEELNIDIEAIRESSGDQDFFESQTNDDHNEDVEVKDIDMDELILDDMMDASEPPSVIGTPVPGAHVGAGASFMSSGLVFRDLDIYSCNYFFGNSIEEKFENPNYFRIHRIRANIGRFFHRLFVFLSKNHENITTVFQALLHGLKVWFTDVGQETIFNEDPGAILDIGFIENIQNLSHECEPYTRTFIALKVDNFHQNRVLLRSTNRRPSKLEVCLLKDIIALATSVYPDIHKPAQGTLVHCMKQLVGSYSMVVKDIIASLEQAISAHEYMQIEVILKVMMINKIHKRLMSDYRNLDQIIFILIDCCKINELEIALYADKILLDIVSGLKIPSSICIHDQCLTNVLTPHDTSIKLQIDAVVKAKKKKCFFYMSLIEKIQNRLVKTLSSETNSNWKIVIFMIRFITKIQVNLETTVNEEIIETIFQQTESRHPQIIKLGVRSLLHLANKILSLSDFDYDISKAYQSNFDPNFIKEIDTVEANFGDSFYEELSNFESPNFFIDSKAYVGWLSWGSKMKVMKPGIIDIVLKENELNALKKFGELVNKSWLVDLISHFVQANETKTIFSSGNVSFFVIILLLISKKLCKLSITDMFDLCNDTYDKYDKATMVVSVEIISALACASKYLEPEHISSRDTFIRDFLSKSLGNDLNQDAFEIWSTMCWWLPTVVDIRRCSVIYFTVSKIYYSLDNSSDAASRQAYKLLMLRNVLISLEFRSPNTEGIFENLIFDHSYDHVREAIAKLLTTLIQNSSSLSMTSTQDVIDMENSEKSGLGIAIKSIPKHIDSFIKKQFIEILVESMKVNDMTPQAMLKTRYYYLSSTMFYWIREMAKGPNKTLLIPYAVEYILPFLIILMKHKDMCKLSEINPSELYIGMAYVPMEKKFVSQIVKIMCEPALMNSSYQKQLQLGLIKHFLSSHLLQLTEADKKIILDFVVTDLFNEQFIEVRNRAASVLSDIVHNLGETREMKALIEEFGKNISKHSPEKRKKVSKTDIKIHGSILGLGAIISAFPYVFPLPKWIPGQLAQLAAWARTSGMTGTAAKGIISDFKKVRTDTWQFDKNVFSYEELEDLEGVLWRSYYA